MWASAVSNTILGRLWGALGRQTLRPVQRLICLDGWKMAHVLSVPRSDRSTLETAVWGYKRKQMIVYNIGRKAVSPASSFRGATMEGANALFVIPPTIPISVNFHFTRQCNYSCGFCFHTAKTSHMLPVDEAKRGLKLLSVAGMRKINFAGGEPFLYPKYLGSLAEYCKDQLQIESVSIVTNGSRVTDAFLASYGKHIDINAVSCDSFDEQTNIKIGRGNGSHLYTVSKVAKLCRRYGIKFKVNTVVNRFNFEEDMNDHIKLIQPFRWKCFQVLVIEDENNSDQTIRNARDFTISDEQFKHFCRVHSQNECFVAEANDVMRSSYLILDEYMRFLNKGTGSPTRSILDVGVTAALRSVHWDEHNFYSRGGVYDWAKENEACSQDTELEW
jgi:radical S-adenosyl methionine domain-containing protein 2